MCEAPLIERFDCGKLTVIEDSVIEDSEQELRTEVVKVNGLSEVSKHSEDGTKETNVTSNHVWNGKKKEEDMAG